MEIVRRIENWPTAFGLRLFSGSTSELRLLHFRSGLNVVCRSGTRDWDVIHELLFAGGYASAFSYLKTEPGELRVLDLGGNLGIFSLLAAGTNPAVQVTAFEPGPPNARLFGMNQLANPVLGERITLRQQAVAGTARQDRWFFDGDNPGGSSLYGTTGIGIDVQIAAFKDVVLEWPDPVALVKIDIEGAEYDLLEHTGAEVWEKVRAISLELHEDPRGILTQAQFIERLRGFGYAVQAESVCSYFLRRE
jgi:FkbM family methyltransferase